MNNDLRSPRRRSRLGLPLAAITLFSVLLTGCAHIPKDLGASEVQSQAHERTGSELAWRGADGTAPAIAALLDKSLTPDSAVQIAFLRNPEVAIVFAELGLSRADLIEAGTLPNPSLSAMVRFATGPATGNMSELNGAFPLLDALMLPLRKKIEAQNFEAAKLRAADRLLGLVAEVRIAWYEAVAAQQERDLVGTSQEAASAAADLARRQYAAGNLSRLDLLSHETLEVQIRLEARELETAAAAKATELRRLLGLRPGDAEWMIMPVLPAASGGALDAAALEAAALTKRLDLAAAEYRIAGMEKGLKLAKRYRFTGPISVGVSADHEADGNWFVGPSLDVQLPIFDRKQGSIARFEAFAAMARAERDATQNRARAEIQTAAAALQSAAERATAYDTELLPLHHDLLEQTQLHYNGMLLGVYDVLNAKRMELEAQRGAVRARLDYWRARTALERAIAGPLPAGASAPPKTTPSVAPEPAAATGEHHHHEEK